MFIQYLVVFISLARIRSAGPTSYRPNQFKALIDRLTQISPRSQPDKRVTIAWFALWHVLSTLWIRQIIEAGNKIMGDIIVNEVGWRYGKH